MNSWLSVLNRKKATLSRWRSLGHWNRVANIPVHLAYEKLGCVFVHIPKTAGLSISNSLFGASSQHRNLFQYRLIFGNAFVDRAFCFCITRHPLTRFISTSHFLLRGGISYSDRLYRLEYLNDAQDLDDVLRALIASPKALSYYHYLPQTYFLTDPCGLKKMDFIGRIENIQADFKFICDNLQVQRSLPLINQRPTQKQMLPVSTFVKDWVYTHYQQDFFEFGYA